MQWLPGLLAWWRNGLECCAAVVPRLCPHCTFIEHHAGIVEEGTEGGAEAGSGGWSRGGPEPLPDKARFSAPSANQLAERLPWHSGPIQTVVLPPLSSRTSSEE